MEPDIQTLSTLLILLCIGYAVGFFTIGRSRIQYRGMGWWSAALIAEAAGFALLSQQGQIDPLFSIVTAWTLIVAGMLLVLGGIKAFYGLVNRGAVFVSGTALFGAFVYYATYAAPDTEARIVGISLVLALLALWTALRLYRSGFNMMRQAGLFVLSGFAAFALYCLFRAWSVLQAPLSDALLTELHETTLIAFIALVGWYSFGFVWMVLYRTSLDLRTVMKIDALTGAYMRRAIFEMLSDEMQRAERSRRPLSIVMIDLDHFKKLNDTLGHVMGDEALVKSVKAIHANIRIFDNVGRYGGEEFLVVLPETDRDTAVGVAERLRSAIAELSVGDEKQRLPLSASFGVTQFIDGDTQEELVERADSALYAAKEGGRNRVVAQ